MFDFIKELSVIKLLYIVDHPWFMRQYLDYQFTSENIHGPGYFYLSNRIYYNEFVSMENQSTSQK